ncbi:MAG: hypothetical protein ABIC91_01760 [Nanoarchaeota archaeon]
MKYKHLIITILSICILGIHFISSFFSSEKYFWGFYHMSVLHVWIRITALIIGLIILMPKINDLIWKIFSHKKIIQYLNIKSKKKILFLTTFFILAFFILFVVFKSKIVHSDGRFLINNIQTGYINQGKMYLLNPMIMIILHRIINIFITVPDTNTIAISSALSGVVYLISIALIGKALFKKKLKKISFFLLCSSVGLIAIFFGDIESYAIFLGFMSIYLLMGVYYLKGKCPINILICSALFTILAHMKGLFIIPSLIFLILHKEKNRKKNLIKVFRVGAYTLIILILFAFFIEKDIIPKNSILNTGYLENSLFTINPNLCVYYLCQATNFKEVIFWNFLHLKENEVPKLFCKEHFFQLFNLSILLGPISFMTLIIFFIFYKNKINFKNNIFVFLLINSIFSFILTFVTVSGYGYHLDWNHFAMFEISIVILSSFLLINYEKDEIFLKRTTLIFFTINLIHTIPWIIFNYLG